MNTINIQNGINLHIIPTEKFKTVSMAMLIRRPLNRDEVTINTLIPSLLKHGSNKYKTLGDVYKQTESMYGAIFDAVVLKKGEEQIIQLFIEVLNKDDLVYEAIDFLGEIALRNLVVDGEFDGALIAVEKENLKAIIASRINDKKEYAKLRCVEEMFKTEPFGLYGDGYAEDIDGLCNIYAHYQSILKTSPIEFICIGAVDEQAVAEKLRHDFCIERGEIVQMPALNVSNTQGDAKTVFEQADISQGKLCMGLRTGISPVGDEFYALLVASEILGGGANSKLFVNVREKESLCYYINSFIYRFKMSIMIQSGVDEANYEKAVSLIQNEIRAIAEGNISDIEFDNAVQSIIKKLVSTVDYPSATMDYYLTQFILNDTNGIEDAVEKIKTVRKEDVQNSFQNIQTDTIYFLKGGK